MNITPIKLKFSHQKFQDDAVNAVCRVFTGQPFRPSRIAGEYTEEGGFLPFTVYGNSTLEILDAAILANIRDIQRKNSLPLSERLEGNTTSLSKWRQAQAKLTPTSRLYTSLTGCTAGANS